MDDVIRLLPVSVANQIAAGEVVQRPASAVKELLENAIDAGASKIQLIIKDAGRTLIQVVDNGKGMSYNDARLAFERHATSKITSADDLFNLNTKGFRGEALASIAAIAQVELKTCRATDELGVKLIVEGSEVKLQDYDACQHGSSISVRNLFFNVPARRNFLKSNGVESKHIFDEFHRVALAHPDIHFELIGNQSEQYILPPGNLRQRISGIFGKNYNERLVPIEESTDVVKVSGFVIKPEFARKMRGEQFLFVNDRYIKSSYLHHAVVNAYSELIPSNEHPSYWIFLNVEPQRIDINIHPTKTEIKFEDERPIYAILQSTIRNALGKFSIKPSLDFDRDPLFDKDFADDREIKQPHITVNPNYNPFKTGGGGGGGGRNQPIKPNAQDREVWGQTLEKATVDFETLSRDLGFIAPDVEETSVQQQSMELTAPDVRPTFFQLDGRYIVSHIRSGIVVIHQQRAHERILYDKYQETDTKIPAQQLIFPLQVALDQPRMTLINESMANMRDQGFDVSTAGDLLIFQAVPSGINNFDSDGFVEALLNELQEGEISQKTNKVALAIARSQCIRSGKKLQPSEMNNLVDNLFACKEPQYSPTGLPIMVIYTLEDLANRFKR